MSDEELVRIRALIADGSPIDAATAAVLLAERDQLKAAINAPSGVSAGRSDQEQATDDPRYEAIHPVVRATAGIFKRQPGAPFILEELRRNAWEERSKQLIRQN